MVVAEDLNYLVAHSGTARAMLFKACRQIVAAKVQEVISTFVKEFEARKEYSEEYIDAFASRALDQLQARGVEGGLQAQGF